MRWLGSLPQDVDAGGEGAELEVCGDVAEQGRAQLVERREPPQEPGGLLHRRGVDRGGHGFRVTVVPTTASGPGPPVAVPEDRTTCPSGRQDRVGCRE